MADIDEVNRDSQGFLTLSFFDQDGQPTVPLSLQYRIDDVTQRVKVQVADWTNVPSPGAVQTITITENQNRILSATNPLELRELTVKVTCATGQLVALFCYRIVNLGAHDR